MATTITDGTTTSTPALVLSARHDRPARNIVHEPIGAVDPDVTLRPAGLRAGAHQFFYLTADEVYAAEDMHLADATLTLTDDENPRNDMRYVPVGQVGVEELVGYGRWVLHVGYQEVGP